jgi:O-antigen/teichoic acid export membrane protein
MIGSLRIWAVSKQHELLPTASLRHRFKTGAFWSLAGGIFSRGSVLLASIGCARILGTRGFGELGMIQSTLGTFGIFAGLGLGLTATKYVAEFCKNDSHRVGRILALSSVIALISGALMGGSLILAAPYVSIHFLGNSNLQAPLAIGSGLIMFGALNGAQTGALTGLEAFQAITLVNVWAGVSTFLLVLGGAWYGGLRGAVWGLVGASGINWLLNNIAIRRECERAQITYYFSSCAKEWRVLYRFSLPAFLASIIVGPAIWISNMLLVNQPNGYAQMGLYTAADKWRLMILFVPTSVVGMALPMLASLNGINDSANYNKVFNANVLLNLGLTILPVAVISVFAIQILSTYGPSYRSAWPILVILAVSSIPEALNNICGYAMISRGMVWLRLAFDGVLACALVGFSIWAIPRWGAVGLAGAYCLAFSLTSFGLFLYLRNDFSKTPPSINQIGI